MSDSPQKFRLRIVFAKKKQVKYVSHLDLSLTWERAMRRAQIPLAYSQGFNPRPKMQFASGLPLGTTGTAEILDIIVVEPIEPQTAYSQIKEQLPVGLGIQSVVEVPLKSPTLQHRLREAEYHVTVETDLSPHALSDHIEGLLKADKIIQTRRRRKKLEEFDLRLWLHELSLESMAEGEACLYMRVTAGQYGNLRPEAVLKALNLQENWAQIERTRLIFEDEVDETGSTVADT